MELPAGRERPCAVQRVRPAGLTALGWARTPGGPALLLLSPGPHGRAVASVLRYGGAAPVPALRGPLTLLWPQDLQQAELEVLWAPRRDGLWLCALTSPAPALPACPTVAVLARWLAAWAGGRDAHACAGRAAALALWLLDAEPRADAGLGPHPGVCPRQLERDFRRCLGVSAGACRRLVRLQRAAAAVLGGVPLARVASGCGYADQPHMTRTFRRVAGVTPGALRALAPWAPPLDTAARPVAAPPLPCRR